MADIIDTNWFDVLLPLPFRVVLLVNLGILLWYINLLTCRNFKIDILMVLKISPQEVTLNKLIFKTKKRLINSTLFNSIAYIIYYFFTSNGWTVPLIDWLPMFCIIMTIIILIKTNSSSFESKRLLETVKRVIKGDIDTSLRNNDILLTDTFTSYNKVLVDFLVYFSALLLGLQTLPSGSDLSKDLSKSHLQIFNIDLLLANLPSLLRLSQCVQEYKKGNKQEINHLLNAIKYSTAFLPTISMILFKSNILETQGLWYFSSFINSSYSFYWDITNDWNFGFFTKFLSNKPSTKLLRNKLIYSKTVYILAIIIDFKLRFLWTYKFFYFTGSSQNTTGSISSFAIFLFSTEIGNFILEILEIFRRWVWVFLKVETEYIKILSSNESYELQNV